MYSPQQNLPSYAQARPREAGFPWRLLILTGVLLALVVLIYAGISFGYRPYLENQLLSVEGQLKNIAGSLQAEEGDVFDVYSQLYNIQALSQKHIYGSKIFTILETGTVPLVKLTKATVDIQKEKLLLEGVASNHDTVVSQLAAYQNVSKVSSVQLVSTALQEDGSIVFVVDVAVEKGYFASPL